VNIFQPGAKVDIPLTIRHFYISQQSSAFLSKEAKSCLSHFAQAE
jgi:hypothetical protein